MAVSRCVFSGDGVLASLACAVCVCLCCRPCAGACLQGTVWGEGEAGGFVGSFRATWHRPKEARGLSTCSTEAGGQGCRSRAPRFAGFCP